MTPVLAAGVGVRRAFSWVLRAASFRMGSADTGLLAVGIVASRAAEATAIVDLLAGQGRPAYGQLRVMGYDMTSPPGRRAVRAQVGVARRSAKPQPAVRVRGLVEHACRRAGTTPGDRALLTASILDRLALAPWADVPVRAAPELIARRARLAAAAVRQPGLLLLDGLLDDLAPRDVAALADAIRDLGRDTSIIAAGRDAAALALVGGEILTLSQGVIARA